MLWQNSQVRKRVNTIIAPTGPHSVHRGNVDARRFSIDEAQSYQEVVHQPRVPKIVVAAFDRHRHAVAQHDWASALDVGEDGRVGERSFARDHVELQDTLAREHGNPMRFVRLDLNRQPKFLLARSWYYRHEKVGHF